MEYRVIRGCVISRQPTQPGDVLVIDDREARALLAAGNIEALPEDQPREDRAIGLGEDKPRRRRGRPPKNAG